jgi:endogenous inhibitor of DNA gyrase (YacG/DUF329 family)
MNKVLIMCENCGKETYNARFCSAKCRDIGHTTKIYHDCPICGTQTVYTYCSKECYHISEKGMKPWNTGLKGLYHTGKSWAW